MDNSSAVERHRRRMRWEIQMIEEETHRLYALRELEGLGESLACLRSLATSTCMSKRPNIGTFYVHPDLEFFVCSDCIKLSAGIPLTPMTRYHCLIPARNLGHRTCLTCGTIILTVRLPSRCRECRSAWRENRNIDQRTIINTETRLPL